MLIKNVEGNEPPYHMASGPAKALIAAGVATEVLPPVPAAQFPNAIWSVRELAKFPSQIVARCSSCGNCCVMEGPTAGDSQTFTHCGGHVDRVPPAIRDQYRKVRAKYNKMPRRVERPVFDANLLEKIRKGL